MATRTTRYRSHSPTPSQTQTYEQPQPFTSASSVGPMASDTKCPQDPVYSGRADLTFPPFSRSMVVGNGAPNSPRHPSYVQPNPVPTSKDGKFYSRNHRRPPILDNGITRDKHYTYEDSYSDFSQTKPPVIMHDTDPLTHRQLPPSLGSTNYSNDPRSLPTIAQPSCQPSYTAGMDANRQMQLSINSIISPPSVDTRGSNYNLIQSPPHGNGSVKKRKKSFGAEGDGEKDNIDSDDRDRDCIKINGGDGGGGGLNGSHNPNANILSFGLEDPDVRMAAEALGDLRADLNHTNRRKTIPRLVTTSSGSSSSCTTGVNSPLTPSQASHEYPHYQNLENAPLLDLIQNNPNPVIRAASAAGRLSAVAYSTSKNLSPGFKYAAESVEMVARGRLGDAVGGLVSTVGKASGLEGFVRRSLVSAAGTTLENRNGSIDINQEPRRLPLPSGTAKKRKKNKEDDMIDINGEMSSSPALAEDRKALQKQQSQQDTQHQNWQTRLILSTAMSEESLKSLKYCLDWLRWANNHLGKCIETLKSVLEEYERERRKQPLEANSTTETNCSSDKEAPSNGNTAITTLEPEVTEERKKMLMGHIERLKGEVLKTLKKVINVVDSYAGGALVGETRNMVKRQLLYLPKRLQIALVNHSPDTAEWTEQSTSVTGPAIDPAAAAQRVIIVAKEGLGMMHNVSKLVEIALCSAEEWCEKLGRKRDSEEKTNGSDIQMVDMGQEPNTPKKQITETGEKKDPEGDVKMGN